MNSSGITWRERAKWQRAHTNWRRFVLGAVVMSLAIAIASATEDLYEIEPSTYLAGCVLGLLFFLAGLAYMADYPACVRRDAPENRRRMNMLAALVLLKFLLMTLRNMIRVFSESAYLMAFRLTLLLDILLLVVVLLIGIQMIGPHWRWLELQIRNEIDRKSKDSGAAPCPPDLPPERTSDETPHA